MSNSEMALPQQESKREPTIVNMPSERRPVPDGYTEVRKGSMPSATRKAVHAGELVGYIIERRLCVKTAEHLEWIERTRRLQPRVARGATDPRDSVSFGKLGVK